MRGCERLEVVQIQSILIQIVPYRTSLIPVILLVLIDKGYKREYHRLWFYLHTFYRI